MDGEGSPLGVVVIGRNEGARLLRCLASLPREGLRLVYVDSGSTDGSLEAAAAAGAQVVELDPGLPFTAARARNAGLAALRDGTGEGAGIDLVQFVDGDCEMQPGWIDTARAFLSTHPRAAVACGRRRERFPEASVYNRLCDREWDTPVGPARACGGDAMMRMAALDQARGFNPAMIAGEEPELCLRLRAAGWEIWRLDHEMTLHDAAITRFGQWWRRSRRSGHAFAEGAALHGGPPEYHNRAERRRILAWGLALPLLTVLALLWFGPIGGLLLLAWPLQILRLALREGAGRRASWEQATFLTLGKLPEALGLVDYHRGRMTRRRSGLIEYK